MKNKLIRIILKLVQLGSAGFILYLLKVSKEFTFNSLVTGIYSSIGGGILKAYDELITHSISTVFAALLVVIIALSVYSLLQIPYSLLVKSLGASKDIYRDTKFYRD